MRNLANRFLVILLILIAGCSKAPVTPEMPEQVVNNENSSAAMRVSVVNDNGITIDSAKIFVDGEYVGFSPLLIASMSYGLHTMRAQKEGYQLHMEQVSIENNFFQNKEIVLKDIPLNSGQLLITVNRDSARITVSDGGQRIVEDTLQRELLLTLERGGYFIRCEKPGYELILKGIDVTADTVTVENLELKKLETTLLPQVVLAVPDSGIMDQPVLISWETSNSQRVDIDYIENPGLYGKREVAFHSTGMHYIKAVAHNEDGQSSSIDSIFIYQVAGVQPTLTLDVTPEKVYLDEVVTIRWQSKNATHVFVDYVPNPGLSGSWKEKFSQSGDVVIRAFASGPGGDVQLSDTVMVMERSSEPPEIDVEIEADTVIAGQNVIIKWSSSLASRVDVDFVPNPGLSGQWVASFSQEGRIIVNAHAYGSGGEAVDSDTLFVIAVLPVLPTVTLEVWPQEVNMNENVTVAWTSHDAERVTVDYVDNPDLAGRKTITFTQAGVYMIHARAFNENGEAADGDSVVVHGAPLLNFEFSASPKEIELIDPVILNWKSDGNQVIIDNGVGVRGPEGSEEILFKNPGVKVFTATAYGDHNQIKILKDSVIVKEPDQPELPVITLSMVDSVEVGKPAIIEWRTWNAHSVDVDYVSTPGLNGKAEIIFQAAGEKIITATAYNTAGQTVLEKRLIVVDAQLELQVETILVPSGAKVIAVHSSGITSVENAGEAQIVKPGYYRVTAAVWYNSGDDQKNESFYLTVNQKNPLDPNAGVHKVVVDDEGPPHVMERDAGLFQMTEGKNIISLFHFYLIADQYPQYIMGGPIRDSESVQILYFKLDYDKELNNN